MGRLAYNKSVEPTSPKAKALVNRISSKTMCLGIDILKPKKEVVYI